MAGASREWVLALAVTSSIAALDRDSSIQALPRGFANESWLAGRSSPKLRFLKVSVEED
jgi:hypothetical protein